MIPRNNPEKFVQQYGEWYYLREFDYLPEPLKYYNRNITKEFIECAAKRTFDLFPSRYEAELASYEIRQSRKLKPYEWDRKIPFSHELEKLMR